MRQYLALLVSLTLASGPVYAEQAPINILPQGDQITAGALIISPNKQFAAVEAEQYFGASWDTYTVTNSSLTHLNSVAQGEEDVQLIGLQNDGGEIRYLQEEIAPQGSHRCSLQVKTSAGATTTLFSFPWEISPNFGNDYVCPPASVSASESGTQLVGFEPRSVYSEVSAVVGPAQYYLVNGTAAQHLLEIPAEDFTAANTLYLGKSWLNERGDALVTVAGDTRTIAYLIPAGQTAERIVFRDPFEVVGLDSEGFILVNRNGDLFRRLEDGSIVSLGRYHSNDSRPLLFENENEGKFSVYDTYNGQRTVLVRGARNKLSDANCHLSNDYAWRITGVLGHLESNRYLARVERSGEKARLAVVDAAELAQRRSFCPVTIATKVKGGAECKSRMSATNFGQQIVASEYETLPSQMRCGIKVTLTDSRGRRVPRFPVALLGTRYSSLGETAIDQRHVTNKNGQVVIWFDVTTPDGHGGGNEVSYVYVASPYGDPKFRSNGVVVYYRYSHL